MRHYKANITRNAPLLLIAQDFIAYSDRIKIINKSKPREVLFLLGNVSQTHVQTAKHLQSEVKLLPDEKA